ncbi:MAG: hypothetical protein V7K98_13225 [Nostoc sp.]|uniref:hypothetical protein n=1 Tax=Nostoc sp. TaxID=1180 RepID=UPI002FF9569B
MTNPKKLLRSREIPFNYEIDGNASLTVLTFQVMWKSHEKPNPLTPFPTFAQRLVGEASRREERERGKFKVSLLKGERFRERFSRYREKSV